jgi:hypothetical protein
MRTAIALALALILLTACAPLQSRRVSESEILLAAKHLSAKNCHTNASSGCTYSPSYKGGEWHVVVSHFVVDKSGNRIFELGNYSEYIFDGSGKFIHVLPGA